jgi:hypothetical protein
MDKRCRTCGETKTRAEFYLRHDSPDGLMSQCKECRREHTLKHYQENTARHAATVKARYDTFGRFRRYGITRERYEQALVDQAGKCALCGASEPGGKGVWHIDHAHDPERTRSTRAGFNQTDDPTLFRGLLCHRCNISLGHYEQLLERIGETALRKYLAGRDQTN